MVAYIEKWLIPLLGYDILRQISVYLRTTIRIKMAEILKTRFGQQQRLFFNTLRQRVDNYFKTNEISKNGNAGMVFKTFVMFAIYLVPYFLILFGGFQSNLLLLALCIVMGVGMAGIGVSVMHDANHGSYSKNA